MYDKTYLMVRKLYIELHRMKYNHVDELEIHKRMIEIIDKLEQLEQLLKNKIEG